LLDFEETISHLSGSLIEIGRENQVAAIHLTVKEFFLSDQAGDFQVKLEEDGNIARTCLNYLRYDLPDTIYARENSKPDREKFALAYPLLEYSSRFLFSHFYITNEGWEDIVEFLQSDRSLTWLEALGTFDAIEAVSTAADIISSIHPSDSKSASKLSRMAYYLSRISALIAEDGTEYPGSIRNSLSASFPEDCLVGVKRFGNQNLRLIAPRYPSWPKCKGVRVSSSYKEDWPLLGGVFHCSFTSCGAYMVHVEIPDLRTPLGAQSIVVTIYQTKRYQPMRVLEPFCFRKEERRPSERVPLFRTQCEFTDMFRIVVVLIEDPGPCYPDETIFALV
jgi:hypothetical protein